VDGITLTPKRSLATDKSFYALKGGLTFVMSKRPTEDSAVGNAPIVFKNFSRFMLDQDTGSAIKGKARGDLYHGEDHYAERAAYNTQHTGKIYFLIAR
jgi:membrane-bound lytic murein transglycosylase A